MHKTPLRLVAVEDVPREDDDREAVPSTRISGEQAITRRVPEATMLAAWDAPEPAKRVRSWRTFAPAVVVGVVVTVFVVALVRSEKRPRPAAAPVKPAPTSVTEPTHVQAAPPTPAAPAKAVPETIHVQVTAEPLQAELSLDGNVLAGHHLNLEVPRDRGVHVLSASAPGFVPVNQQVTFANDVVLNIRLRRDHAAPTRRAARARSSQVESRPPAEVTTPAAPARPRVEPGMNIEAPTTHPSAKPIDERNPYKP